MTQHLLLMGNRSDESDSIAVDLGDDRLALVDAMDAGTANHVGRDQTQSRQIMQGLLNRPEAMTIADQPMQLTTRQRGPSAEQRRKDAATRPWDHAAEGLVEEHACTMTVI